MMTALPIGLVLGLVMAISASARDLPRGQARAATPTGCEAYGPGFRKLEGSDSCVKIGGSIRVESTVTSGGGAAMSPSGLSR